MVFITIASVGKREREREIKRKDLFEFHLMKWCLNFLLIGTYLKNKPEMIFVSEIFSH